VPSLTNGSVFPPALVGRRLLLLLFPFPLAPDGVRRADGVEGVFELGAGGTAEPVAGMTGAVDDDGWFMDAMMGTVGAGVRIPVFVVALAAAA
jgi:hypothetical protein